MPTYVVRYTLVDSEGREGTKTFETQNLADYAAALVAADALADDLAVVSGAEILRYSISEILTYVDAVTAGSNKDEGVTLVVRKTDSMRDVIRIPAPTKTYLDGSGNVDITDAGVLSYFDNFTSSGDFLFSDGELAVTLLSGKLDV